MNYTIELVGDKNCKPEHIQFLCWVGKHLNDRYGKKFKLNMKLIHYLLSNHRVVIVRRNGEMIGCSVLSLYPSIFDEGKWICKQEVMYAKPKTRAAYILMNDLIDFGKRHAHHVISMIAENTNIKPRSLEKLGFKKLETLYRIEV